MRVLIVEQLRTRGVLAATRALAADGATVGIGSPHNNGLASWSRAACAWHRVPAVDEDLDTFIATVAGVVAQGRYEIVFGGGEAEVLALTLAGDRVGAVVPYPEHDVLVRALDKQTLSEAATEVGIASPRTIPTDEIASLSAAVVKARMHADPQRRGAPPRVDTNAVFGSEAIARRVRYIESLGGVPVVQEFVSGPLTAYSAVLGRDGTLLAACAQEASAIWPPYAGASCRARTVRIDPSLETRCLELLRNLGWFGLAELQFVVSPSGEPFLIDLNGRFYGSLSLAVAAGANLPAVWARSAMGLPASRRAARPGVRYQWLEGDLRRAWVERRRGLLVDVAATVVRAPFAHHSIWSRRDPLPALRHVRELAGGTRQPAASFARQVDTKGVHMSEPKEILERSRTIAVVGASADDSKPSHTVPANLQRAGFNVIPVNPSGDEILGRRAATGLSEIDEPVDVVEVFRPAEEAPDIAREAVAIGAKVLWLQLGLRSDEARQIAEEGGLDYVEDHCMGNERDKYDITKEQMDPVS